VQGSSGPDPAPVWPGAKSPDEGAAGREGSRGAAFGVALHPHRIQVVVPGVPIAAKRLPTSAVFGVFAQAALSRSISASNSKRSWAPSSAGSQLAICGKIVW
jgi:hypothetical protein